MATSYVRLAEDALPTARQMQQWLQSWGQEFVQQPYLGDRPEQVARGLEYPAMLPTLSDALLGMQYAIYGLADREQYPEGSQGHAAWLTLNNVFTEMHHLVSDLRRIRDDQPVYDTSSYVQNAHLIFSRFSSLFDYDTWERKTVESSWKQFWECTHPKKTGVQALTDAAGEDDFAPALIRHEGVIAAREYAKDYMRQAPVTEYTLQGVYEIFREAGSHHDLAFKSLGYQEDGTLDLSLQHSDEAPDLASIQRFLAAVSRLTRRSIYDVELYDTQLSFKGITVPDALLLNTRRMVAAMNDRTQEYPIEHPEGETKAQQSIDAALLGAGLRGPRNIAIHPAEDGQGYRIVVDFNDIPLHAKTTEPLTVEELRTRAQWASSALSHVIDRSHTEVRSIADRQIVLAFDGHLRDLEGSWLDDRRAALHHAAQRYAQGGEPGTGTWHRLGG